MTPYAYSDVVKFGAYVLQNLVHVLHPRREVSAVAIRLVKLCQRYRISHEFLSLSFQTFLLDFHFHFKCCVVVIQQLTSISGSGPELPESAAASSASAIVILLLMAGRLSKCL